MNIEFYKKLMTKGNEPRQRFHTWQMFLEICELYMRNHHIANPVVVELGVMRNRQKMFYEELLNAYHIGIDISDTKGIPDILGDTHDSETLKELKMKLKGRKINILFIDASHTYVSVKKDYEIYAPLCDGIIAIDDINLSRYAKRKRKRHGVWLFWDELKVAEHYDDYLFLSITQCKDTSGLGLVIKK